MAEYTCVHCGETRKAPPSTAARRLYCSWECRIASGQQHLQGKGMAICYPNCSWCGRLFVARAKRVGRYEQVFCSMGCRNSRFGDGSRRTVGLVAKQCDRCGAEMLIPPSRLRQKNRGQFCSRACNALANTPGTTSKISAAAVDQWATSESVLWVQEYILGPYAIDLALPLEQIAIELDGEFWHSIPRVVANDKRKNTYLANRGWTVVRVPMLKKDTPEMVSGKIIAAIKKARRQRRREARKGA